jgi:hypothetical protein
MRVLVFLVFLLPVFAIEASACSCAGAGTPCQDYWKADAVFMGTVSYISSTTYMVGEHEFRGRLVRFTVERGFRGVNGSDIEVTTGLGDSDCGYGFRLGGQYLVYAYETGGKSLATGICSRTRPSSEALDDLAYIEGLAEAAPGATIFGEVKRLKRDVTSEERLQPLPTQKLSSNDPRNKLRPLLTKRASTESHACRLALTK